MPNFKLNIQAILPFTISVSLYKQQSNGSIAMFKCHGKEFDSSQ